MKKILVIAMLLICNSAYALTVNIQENQVTYTAAQILTTSTSNVTESFPLGPFQNSSFQCVWGAVTGTQPQYKLQFSNNNSNWDDVPNATTITTGTSGSETWIVWPVPSTSARVNVTTASTTGTLDCKAVASGRR